MSGSGTSSLLAWAVALLRQHRTALTILAVLSLAEVLLRALQPWALKAVVDYALMRNPLPGDLRPWLAGLPPGPVWILLTFVIAWGGVQLAHYGVLMAHGRVQSRAAQHLVYRLRAELFAHVQCLALAHHTRTPTGRTVYHLEADAACLEHLIFRGLYPIAFSGLTLLFIFASLARIDPVLVAVSASVVPALFFAVRFHTGELRRHADRVKLLESEVTGHLHESLSAIALTKSFAREQYESRRFSDRATRAIDARLALARVETRFAFVVGAITVVGASVTLLLGGLRVLRGELSVGTLLVILAYLTYIYGPMSVVANTAGTLQSALSSARRVRETLALPTERDGTRSPGPQQGAVSFEQVTFAYGTTPVLREVSLSASPGELIALVGPSGAGKTTLVSLINRFYEASSGCVRLDGVDVRQYRLEALRARVAVVLQEAVLISGSIAENIRYGRPDASDDEVEAAARAAHAHEFIMALPHGYATEMERAGATLSGGQRQRLSLARAFLKDAPILILDEPTSALDALTERLVLDALTRLRAGRTTFVIAHRLSTVREADRIVVLDRGEIVAQGPHERLLETSPLYQRLCSELVESPSQV